MFKRSFPAGKDHRAGKAKKISRRSYRDDAKQHLREQLAAQTLTPETSPSVGSYSPALLGSIVTIAVGKSQRLFAAHEDVLSRSPWFADECHKLGHFGGPEQQRNIHLPDDEPEVFSAVLEYLYKGDYSPRLLHDKRRDTWSLADGTGIQPDPAKSPSSIHTKLTSRDSTAPSTAIYISSVGDYILRDTAIYCAAGRFELPDLQRLALRKQGLASGIDVATILRSARFAYSHTPATDSRLRAHYLALVIRSRKTFKRSGTMQMEMEKGGTQLFFDLFVAMCNHIDDVSGLTPQLDRSPIPPH